MKSSGGFEQCYNTQAAVDEETQMIVATGVTNNAADNRQLLGMIDAVQENLEHPPEQVVADAGYKSEENFEGLEEREIDGYISLGREGRESRAVGKSTRHASHVQEAGHGGGANCLPPAQGDRGTCIRLG